MIKNFITFPDGQPHLNPSAYDYKLTWPIRNPTELLQLCQISEAMDNEFIPKKELFIPYLMGARSDRHMQPDDSFDLKVIAGIINSCYWQKVVLFDVHSDVALALIDRSINENNRILVDAYRLPDSILICPDAGAQKKVDSYLRWNENLVQVVYCQKSRDRNGKITLKVLDPQICLNRNVVIIDDLCDGGGTFEAIQNQINPNYLTLIVTHGIFSKGLPNFDHIITTNSYQNFQPTSKLTVLKI